ncbi:MAG: tetratricopeptide repeat protein [Methanoregula sp.]|nr:tetratricopeptide repeat protein [Methanoregula sp.]
MYAKKIMCTGFFALLLLVLCTLPVLAYSPDATDWYAQGNMLMKNKNYTQAIGAYEEAITLAPDYYEAWNGKADALNRAQQFKDALAASDKALSLNPEYVQGWINRGYILYNLGRNDDELKAYEMAISIDPSSPDAWFNKGYSLAGMKRYDEAISVFDTVRSLDFDYPNLAANRRIAEQSRDAATPWYVKNALTMGIIALFAVGAIAWFISVKKEY